MNHFDFKLIGALMILVVKASLTDAVSKTCIVQVECKARRGFFWHVVNSKLIAESRGTHLSTFLIQSPGMSGDAGTWSIKSLPDGKFLRMTNGEMIFKVYSPASSSSFTFYPRAHPSGLFFALRSMERGNTNFYIATGEKGDVARRLMMRDYSKKPTLDDGAWFDFQAKDDSKCQIPLKIIPFSTLSFTLPIHPSTSIQLATVGSPIDSGRTVMNTVATTLVKKTELSATSSFLYSSVTGVPICSQSPFLIESVGSCLDETDREKYERELQTTLETVNDGTFLENKTVSEDSPFLHLVDKVEKNAMKLARSLGKDELIHIKTLNIVVKAVKQRLFKKDYRFPAQPRNASQDQINSYISIPKQILNSNGSVTVISVAYRNMEKYMYNKQYRLRESSNGFGELVEFSMAGELITAAIWPRHEPKFTHNVTIRIKHAIRVPEKMELMCGYLVVPDNEKIKDTSGSYMWSTHGCWKESTNVSANYTVCTCNHLTTFSILMVKTSGKFKKSAVVHVLNVVSTIGCILSIVFLAIGIIIFLFLFSGGHKSERNMIHFNLMISLLVRDLVFLFGLEAIQYKILCRVIAYVMHYMFLATFSWMFVEGINLYLMLVRVFDNGRSKLRIYTVLGWGTPVIIVAITAGVTKGNYLDHQLCWMSKDEGIVWAFIGPALLIIIANSVFLVLVLKEIVVLSGAKKTSASQIRTGLRSALFLLPLLGLTWAFNLLVVNRHTVIFHFLFGIFNTLQGFLVVVFHCFMNSEVRKALQRRKEVIMLSYSVRFQKLNSISPRPSKVVNSASDTLSVGSKKTSGEVSELSITQVKIEEAKPET